MKAYWITDGSGKVKGLVLPDLYGKEKILSPSEVLGRFSILEIQNLRSSLEVR